MARVLHLFNVFGALTERAMGDYVSALSKRFDVTVGCETLAPEAPAVWFPVVKLARVNVEPTEDVAGQMRRVANEVEDPARREFLGQRFDLVHGHFGPRILHGAAWLARGVPMVVSTYGYDVGRLCRDRCWIERYRWAAERGATFVALAKFMENRLLEFGLPAERVRRIHLGIDLNEHAFEPTAAPRAPRFVFVGRFVDKKGADVLVEAMALLKQQGVRAELDLIGGGPNDMALREQVATLELEDRVKFVGVVPFAKLFDYLRGCTAMVQPSMVAPDGDAEGAPMVLMSAQACGVPCVTTRHSGNPETIPQEGQRFVVPERDPAALAAAMRGMMEMSSVERTNLQVAGRRWIETEFELRGTVRAYSELYDQLIAPK
jgi:glycosyltransferase involved in cell wall biosynthesis